MWSGEHCEELEKIMMIWKRKNRILELGPFLVRDSIK